MLRRLRFLCSDSAIRRWRVGESVFTPQPNLFSLSLHSFNSFMLHSVSWYLLPPERGAESFFGHVHLISLEFHAVNVETFTKPNNESPFLTLWKIIVENSKWFRIGFRKFSVKIAVKCQSHFLVKIDYGVHYNLLAEIIYTTFSNNDAVYDFYKCNIKLHKTSNHNRYNTCTFMVLCWSYWYAILFSDFKSKREVQREVGNSKVRKQDKFRRNWSRHSPK